MCGAVACDSTEALSWRDPWQPGPFPVGVRDDLYFDHSRNALAWTGCPAGDGCARPLRVSIWYPAVDEAAAAEPMQLVDFLGVTEATLDQVINELVDELGADRVEVNFADKALGSILDARLRPGRWPLVVFSHGAGGVRFQSVFLTEYLASHGFIVISPDHEGDATLTVIEGQVVKVQVRSFVQSAFERPLDVSFLIDRMAEADRNPDHWLYGAVETARVGATGHSFGAFTSITVVGHDRRVAAIVPKAAPGFPKGNPEVPALFMIATEDETIDEIGNEAMVAEYELWSPPKARLDLLDAGHYTYSNMCDLIPDFGGGCGPGKRITDGEVYDPVDPDLAHAITNGMATAWFGAWLRQDPRYLDALLDIPALPGVRFHFAWSGLGRAQTGGRIERNEP